MDNSNPNQTRNDPSDDDDYLTECPTCAKPLGKDEFWTHQYSDHPLKFLNPKRKNVIRRNLARRNALVGIEVGEISGNESDATVVMVGISDAETEAPEPMDIDVDEPFGVEQNPDIRINQENQHTLNPGTSIERPRSAPPASVNFGYPQPQPPPMFPGFDLMTGMAPPPSFGLPMPANFGPLGLNSGSFGPFGQSPWSSVPQPFFGGSPVPAPPHHAANFSLPMAIPSGQGVELAAQLGALAAATPMVGTLQSMDISTINNDGQRPEESAVDYNSTAAVAATHHMSEEDQKENTLQICSVCQNTFLGDYSLLLHMKNHEGLGCVAFNCEWCTKRYVHLGWLVKHWEKSHGRVMSEAAKKFMRR